MFIHMHICTYAKKLKDLLSFIVAVVVILHENMKMVSLNFLTTTLYWKNMLLFLCSIMFERKLKKNLCICMDGKQPTCRSKATSKNWISIWIVWQRRKKDRRVVYCTKAIVCKTKCYQCIFYFYRFGIFFQWFWRNFGEQWKLSWSINGITESGNMKKIGFNSIVNLKNIHVFFV